MDSTSTPETSEQPAQVHTRGRGSIIGGVVLIVLGILFLMDNFFDVRFSDFWPLILIAIGAGLLWQSRAGGKA